MTYYGMEVYRRMRDWWDGLSASSRAAWLGQAGGHPDDIEKEGVSSPTLGSLSTYGYLLTHRGVARSWSELRALTRDNLTKARALQALTEDFK